MRSKRDRLDLVKQVFAKRENKLAQEMGQFEAQLDQAVSQLKQLRDHRDRHAAALRSGLSTDLGRMQNQQAFYRRLNDAISQQELLIQRAKLERAELRQRWLAKRRRTLSVEKLSEIRTAAELREESIREQKQQDEISRFPRLHDSD